jgi:hypothetical protein
VKITPAMVECARRAEYDHYQRNRLLGPGPYRPTSDAVIRVMLEAALGGGKPTAAALTNRVVKRSTVAAIAKTKTAKPASAVVRARKPKRR